MSYYKYIYLKETNSILIEKFSDPEKTYKIQSSYMKLYDDSKVLLHRDDGPALIQSNARLYYYRHGKLHRDDGYAIIDNMYKSSNRYYFNGFEVKANSLEDFKKKTKYLNIS